MTGFKLSPSGRRKANLFQRLMHAYEKLSHARLVGLLGDADPMKRRVAGSLLRRRNSPAVIRDALQLCGSANPLLREQAAWLLGRLDFPATEPGQETEKQALALLHALADTDPRKRVRTAALDALQERDDKQKWEQARIAEGRKPETSYQRRKAEKESRLFWEYLQLPHVRLVALLGDPDPMKRSVAVRELQSRSSKAALRDALKLCRSGNPVLREGAALVLGQLKFPADETGQKTTARVMARLLELALDDPRAMVRAGALFALGHRASYGGDPALVLRAAQPGSRDRACNVRYATAFALGYVNLPGAQTALLRLLRDKDRDVRNWAAFAVFMQGDQEQLVYDTPEIRAALLQLAEDPDWEVRYEAFRSLGVLREKRAAPLLARELDNDEAIYFDLAKAAGRIGDPALIPVLEKALERFGDDPDPFTNEPIIQSALQALRSGEKPQNPETLPSSPLP